MNIVELEKHILKSLNYGMLMKICNSRLVDDCLRVVCGGSKTYENGIMINKYLGSQEEVRPECVMFSCFFVFLKNVFMDECIKEFLVMTLEKFWLYCACIFLCSHIDKNLNDLQ